MRSSSAWAARSMFLAGRCVPKYTRTSRRHPRTEAQRRRCCTLAEGWPSQLRSTRKDGSRSGQREGVKTRVREPRPEVDAQMTIPFPLSARSPLNRSNGRSADVLPLAVMAQTCGGRTAGFVKPVVTVIHAGDERKAGGANRTGAGLADRAAPCWMTVIPRTTATPRTRAITTRLFSLIALRKYRRLGAS